MLRFVVVLVSALTFASAAWAGESAPRTAGQSAPVAADDALADCLPRTAAVGEIEQIGRDGEVEIVQGELCCCEQLDGSACCKRQAVCYSLIPGCNCKPGG